MANSCPVITSPQWKSLVQGLTQRGLDYDTALKEAYRDFYENEDIRTTEEVVEKLKSRNFSYDDESDKLTLLVQEKEELQTKPYMEGGVVIGRSLSEKEIISTLSDKLKSKIDASKNLSQLSTSTLSSIKRSLTLMSKKFGLSIRVSSDAQNNIIASFPNEFIEFIDNYTDTTGNFKGTLNDWIMYREMKRTLNSDFDNYLNNKKILGLENSAEFKDFQSKTEEQKKSDVSYLELGLQKQNAIDKDKNIITEGNNTDVTVFDIMQEETENPVDYVSGDEARKEDSENLLAKLFQSTNIKYNFITEEQAEDLLKESSTPYKGDAGFFFNGEVYFVKGKIDKNTMIHEYSHPLVMELRMFNNELFNNIYDSLSNSQYGSDVIVYVVENYPELDTGTDEFKEECIAVAIERMHQGTYQQEGAFKKFIKDFIYAFKRLLRGVFGNKIEISELDTNTTLGELYSMLEHGERFDLHKSSLTRDDVAMFKRSFIEIQSDLDRFYSNPQLASAITQTFNAYEGYIHMLEQNDGLYDLKKLHLNVFGKTEFQKDFKLLSETKENAERSLFQNMISEVDLRKNRVYALGESLLMLEDVTLDMDKVVYDIVNNVLDREAVIQLYNYNNLVDYWLNFIEEIKKSFQTETIEKPHKFFEVLSRCEQQLTSVRNRIDNSYLDIATDVIYEQLQYSYMNLQEEFDNQITALNGVPQLVRDKLYKRYYNLTESEFNEYSDLSRSNSLTNTEKTRLHTLNIKLGDGVLKTKDQIRQTLKGELGDAGYMNSKFEGYMYSSDPIIGGFAMFHKESLTKALNKSLEQYNDFAYEIKEKLDRAGYSKINIGSLGRMLTFRDKVFAKSIDEENPSVEKEVITYLNPFKNYRHDIGVLQDAVRITYNEFIKSPNEQNYSNYLQAKQKLEVFCNDYMNQPYVEEYYRIQNEFKHSELGQKAIDKQNEIREAIKVYERMKNDPINYSLNDEQIDAKIEELKFDLRRLSSITNLDGTLKDESSEEYQIAKTLKKYNDDMRKFMTQIVDTEQFDKDFIAFRKSLLDQGLTENDDMYQSQMANWCSKNMHFAGTIQWEEKKDSIQQQINSVMTEIRNLRGQTRNENVDSMYQQIFSMINGFKDGFGEVDVSLFEPTILPKIKELQEEIYAEMDDNVPSQDLDYNVELTLNSLKQRLKTLMQSLRVYLDHVPTEIYMDQFENAIRSDETITIDSLRTELGIVHNGESAKELLLKIADVLTSGYEYISSTGETFSGKDIQKFLQNHPVFASWFNDIHAYRENSYFRSINGNREKINVQKFYRLMCFDKLRPTEEEDFLYHIVKDPVTNTVIAKLEGRPAASYQKSVVKDEYTTKKVVGETVDNRGNWLPKNREKMSLASHLSDDPNAENYKYKFINKQYEQLSAEQKDLLESFVNFHLNTQQNADNSSKLYLDIPRFRSEFAENLVKIKDEGLKNSINLILRRMKMFFTGGADDYEYGVGKTQQNLIYLDTIGDNLQHIPVSGRYDLDVNDVSLDIIRSMFRYSASIQRASALREASPYVKAIERTVDSNDILTNDLDAKMLNNGSIIKFIAKKDNLRREAIHAFIDKNYKGINLKGIGDNAIWAQNLINLLFGRASFSFFAFNIPSALKNSFGIKFQALLESSSGKYLDPSSLAKGNVWSYDAMASFTFGGFYNHNQVKSLQRQIIESFDLLGQDITEKTFMEPLVRSLGTDILDLRWMYAPRQWVEQQATCQVGSGILFKNKVQYKKDGVISDIDYIDAFEADENGIIKLKDGVDITYDLHDRYYMPEDGDTIDSIAEKFNIKDKTYLKRMLGNQSVEDLIEKYKRAVDRKQFAISRAQRNVNNQGVIGDELLEIEKNFQREIERCKIHLKNENYLRIRNQIHQVNNNLGGAYAHFDQPDMHRTMLYRLICYMKRYFTTMFMNRFGMNARFNPGLGDIHRGFYVDTLDFLITALKTGGKNINYATPAEKEALIKFGTELVMLVSIPVICQLLFGYDPDDEDKFKKLKEKSGALQIPGFTHNNKKRTFDLLGYSELHTLHLLQQIRYENEQFNPFCGGIKQMAAMTDFKSVVFGPTTDTWVQLLSDMKNIAIQDPKAYYSREVGPYNWQEKGDWKGYNHILKMFGFTGTSLDPALAVQNLQSNIARIK